MHQAGFGGNVYHVSVGRFGMIFALAPGATPNRVAVVVCGLAMVGVGAALATDFRGNVTRNARRTVGLNSRIKAILLRSGDLSDDCIQKRIHRQIVVGRIWGFCCLTLGIIFIILSIFAPE